MPDGLETTDRFSVEQLIRAACGGAYPEEGEGLWWGTDAFTFQSPWSTPWPEITAPGTPASDYGAWYVKDSGGASMPFFKSDDGTEYNLSTMSAGSVNINDLGDVSITGFATGDYLRYDGSNVVDVTVAQIITDLALDDIVAGSGIGVTNGADTIIGGNATIAIGALTGDHDFGPHKITAEQVAADIADGTAPLIIASTTVVANLQAATAARWHTTRTITMTGDVSADAVNIDGTGNVDITTTVVANDSHTHDTQYYTETEIDNWIGTTNITTLGTIGTGTWEGTVVDSAYIDQSLAVASLTASGTVQAEHLYSTDDAVIDDLLTVGGGANITGGVLVTTGHINTAGTYAYRGYGVGAFGDANTEFIGVWHSATSASISVTKTGTGSFRPLMLVAGGTSRLEIDVAGNVGLGKVPDGWHSTYTALQIGGNAAISGQTAAGASKVFDITQNANVDTDGSWEYISTDEASLMEMGSGKFDFYTAVSGTAGDNITWAKALTITNANNFTLGGNKTQDFAAAGTALDDIWADDFQNEADFYWMDERFDGVKMVPIDDLAIICGIRPSEQVCERTGMTIIDDKSLPEWVFTRDKVTSETARDPEGKPYMSLTMQTSLSWGAIRQLVERIEQLEARLAA